MKKKRRMNPAKRAHIKLKRQVRSLSHWRTSKVPTDLPTDSDDIAEGVELQGVDSRGCSLVAALVILVICAALAAAHIATNLLV